MAVTTFIPELWSARLLYALEKAHVATNLVNRNYEGVIANQGDTVHINSIGAITVKDYTKNTDIAAPDALTTTDQTLEIDQCKYFNFQVDDVDKVQAAGDLVDTAMGRAAYALADTSDAFLLKTIAAGAAAGTGGAAAFCAGTSSALRRARRDWRYSMSFWAQSRSMQRRTLPARRPLSTSCKSMVCLLPPAQGSPAPSRAGIAYLRLFRIASSSS